MTTLNIRVRVANKVKHFRTSAAEVCIGRSKSCDVVLPFAWLENNHLYIEAESNESVRVRAGSASAMANAAGVPVGTEWQSVPCPAHIAVPTPRGHSIVLEVSVGVPDLELYLLQEGQTRATSSAGAAEDMQLEVATTSALGAASGATVENDEFTATDWQAPIGFDEARVTQSQKLVLYGVAAVFVVLIFCSLGFNRYRHSLAREALATDVKFVSDRIALARELLGRKEYVAAKAALDAAAETAKRVPTLDTERGEIAELLKSQEIRMGAAGYVEMDGQWLDQNRAKAWKAARERDDPRIAQLEQQAALALQTKDYNTARAAYEEIIGIMDREPVRPHPRWSAITSALESVKKQASSAEMTAKGYVYHEGRWITKEQQARIENTAKGLVEYEGEWMTPTQVAEAKKRGGTGKVLYEGKWVTTDQKMEMQGYVKFEGVWVRPEERDALVQKRKADQEKIEQEKKDAEAQKAEADKAEKLKSVAYAKSQDYLIKKYSLTGTKFDAFGASSVRVAYDEGWFIIKATASGSKADGARFSGKTYYAKIRPGTGDQWEIETLILTD